MKDNIPGFIGYHITKYSDIYSRRVASEVWSMASIKDKY